MHILFERYLSVSMCSFIQEHFHNYFGTSVFFFARRLSTKQRLSLVNPTVVTKLQFVRIKTELVNIARWITTQRWRHLIKMIREVTEIANIIHLMMEETQLPKGCHFLGLPCKSVVY